MHRQRIRESELKPGWVVVAPISISLRLVIEGPAKVIRLSTMFMHLLVIKTARRIITMEGSAMEGSEFSRETPSALRSPFFRSKRADK